MDLEEMQAKITACAKDMVAAHRAGLEVSASKAIYKHFGLDEANKWTIPECTIVLLTVHNEPNAAVAKLNAKRRP